MIHVVLARWFAGGYLVYILVGPVALYGLDRCGRARRSRFVLRVTRLEAMKGATIVEYDIPTDLAARVYPGQYVCDALCGVMRRPLKLLPCMAAPVLSGTRF